jgi:hypothetical protein
LVVEIADDEFNDRVQAVLGLDRRDRAGAVVMNYRNGRI